ncbi:MAG: DUF2007 domain-containing protein [Colwellia sp.]|nr:DUF2007 domain-containing protein [Colwellia sp.]
MKKVYTNEISLLVSNMKNIIEAQEIDVFIKNEYAQGAVGEISAFDTWPEIWVVNDNDFDHVMEIVNSSQKNDNTLDWICKSCAEENDASFEVCWKCQSENT